ncbi:2-hydroxychromene-2-carboxylate isomerase [Pseudoduganella namucuonensis]|uniref:2-hydroxychromene-2-carboxylate isomerase n=1 Tax=Pseudoduganella namucuonensis TaxID=1035707 RepID=A0A1I7L340_9BURK|nr:2-hydroxychromene-2-carboxylate isomerase [Pseudoduganella namucuonensis]SFV04055.1 2-hydroxychromene-2-carboxylate isomerase [Pseudoduganella namucuonensis]
MEPIDFYFDFASPYGYFAATCIDELAARHRREVRWTPILMAAMFQATGGTPLPLVPVKGTYVLHDIDRTARQHGIVYRQPAAFPELLLAAPRAMLWIRETHGHDLAVRFAKRCYRAYFAERKDIDSPQALLALAAELGIGPGLEEGMRSAEGKERLKLANAAALERGVFGSPFVIADGEPFWGFDRFSQLEAWLAGGGVSWRYWARRPRIAVGAKWNTNRAVAAAG